MEFFKDLWGWLRLYICPLPQELQELADAARELDLRISHRMTHEEFLAFIKKHSVLPEIDMGKKR